MKKTVAVMILFSLLMSVTAFASSTAEVWAETVTASADKAVMIPVKIKNNTGIMGFRINVEYDSAVLTSPKVTKGSVTENGMMNDSIGVTPEGAFDVVWSSTRNEVGDGTLMILSFTAVKAEDTEIKLSCSQPDTFNEEWENVELKCTDISVVFSDTTGETVNIVSDPVPVTESETESVLPSESEKAPSSEEIKNAVEIAIGEAGKAGFEDISEEERAGFVDRANEILSMLTGENGKMFESVEEIKIVYNEAVAEEFVDGARETVDSDKIDAVINDSLSSVGAESIEQIPAEKKEDFVLKVEENLVGYAPDTDRISDKLTCDEAFEAIKTLQNENSEDVTDGKKLPESQKNESAAPLAAAAVAVTVMAAIITGTVVSVKRKKKEET